MEYITRYFSPLGEMVITGNEEGLTGLHFVNQKYFPEDLYKKIKEDINVDTKEKIKKNRDKNPENSVEKVLFEDTIENINDNLDTFIRTKKVLDNYFSTGKIVLDGLKLSPRGSKFRQKVWNILKEIPDGEVVTYKDIAEKISADDGKNMSAQAVGGAVGHNPIAILIPCHRVVGQNKNLTGYAGGMDKKIKLLEIEGWNQEDFSMPK